MEVKHFVQDVSELIICTVSSTFTPYLTSYFTPYLTSYLFIVHNTINYTFILGYGFCIAV